MGYVALPEYHPGGQINFGPVNQAFAAIAEQNNQDRQFGMQQKQIDAQTAERTYQHGRDAKQDQNAEIKLFGDRAKAFAQLPPDDPVRQNWSSFVKARHPNVANLDPRYLDPVEGPKLVMAEAGEYLDPRDSQAKDLEIQKTRAEINSLNTRDNTKNIKEVNGRLVRVDPDGTATEIYTSGPDQTKAPQGYRFGPDGNNLVPIPGGPGDKLTEGESKDALFAERLIRSNSAVDKLMNVDEQGNIRGYNPTKNINAYVPDSGLVANLVNSDEWKNYQQAAREGLASILRKDTGAAVTPEEFKLYFPTYYPQPGDDAATVLQKKIARERFGSGLRGASSRAFDRMYPNYEAGSPAPKALGGNNGNGPAQGSPAAPSRPRAVNPQNGHAVEWDGQKWVDAQ